MQQLGNEIEGAWSWLMGQLGLGEPAKAANTQPQKQTNQKQPKQPPLVLNDLTRESLANYRKDHPGYNPPSGFVNEQGQKVDEQGRLLDSSMSQKATVKGQVEGDSTQNLSYDQIESKMRKGFTSLYGKNSPALQYIPQIMNQVKSNPFWKNNPFLAASQMIAETSGGTNITRPNNLTNWGIDYPGNNAVFAKMTPEQVFDRYLTGLGTRDPNFSKYRTGKKLSQQELQDFGKQYAPDDTTYGQRLNDQIQSFENQ